MPIMIPVNIDDCPTFPTFDMNEYLAQVSSFATSLWQTMSTSSAKKSLELSEEDIKNGRVLTFNSADDMCAALGI